MSATTSVGRRKTVIHVKRDQAPVRVADAIVGDPWVSRQEVYVSGGLLFVVLATDIRLDAPDTIYCRFQADESPAPPRLAYRLTATSWERIESQTIATLATMANGESRDLAIVRLANLKEFIKSRNSLPTIIDS